MTPGIPAQPSPAPALDDAWLARAAQTVLHVSDGIDSLQLSDPDTGLRCFARSAPLAGSGALQDEARLAARLQADWAAVPVATLRGAERMVVVYGGAPASTLAATLGDTRPAVARFLELAIGSARALAGAHAHGLLHGDIRPHNLLVDAGSDDGTHVRLTGFDHATALDAMPPVVPRPGPAAWPYQSPEVARADQARTGARSDLYSLGVTFYQMLTGALPFTADSPAAWQHAHLAVEPVPPHLRAPGIAPLLGAIVLRLMAKDPVDRYAGAMSLLADLLRCQADWRERGEIAPFTLDAAGPTSTLNVSGELFGRARETAQLADALARVRHSGQSELVLIAGAAGTGKSALAAWLSCQAGQQGMRFASGKSDQLQPDIPYAPVAQMIRALTLPLLGEPEAALAPVRERWLEALAGQGRAIAVLVPEAAHVLGRTAPLAEVPAQQAQARAQKAILATFATFADQGAPLVLCFDDLQWADASTIALLEAFTTQRPRNLLLLAAYRDHGNEVEQRFSWLLHASRAGALPVTRIAVRPLTVWELTGLVAAALNVPAPRVQALAQLVHAKTGGNPFFSYQLLRALVDDGVLAYRGGRAGWYWDEADAAQHHYTDSVTDLMTRRFARLPQEGTELLTQLACVGIRCEQSLLACVAQLSAAQLGERLRPFVEAGLLVRSGDGYAFQHDRVLEAAYAMIAPRERPAAHARIAGIMIEHWHGELAAHAFEIGNQIERAAGHPLPEPQRVAFVQVLLVAARRARRSAAMAQATRYTDAAFALMQPSWWTTHCALAYAASVLHCECLLAQARLEPASREIDALLARDLPPVDKAAVHRLKASLQTVRSDYEGAISAALSGLALLDIHLERGPTPARMREAYDAVKQALGGRAIASLGRLPATEDSRIQTIMGLLSTLISSLFVRDGISFLHVAKMVELTLAHGATAESPYGLSWFGVFIASLYEEYEDGLAYGLAAMDLADRHGYEAERIATLVALDQVSAWTRPLSYALAQAQRAVTLGLASGDIGMACYACNHIASDLLAMGEHLRLVEEEIGRGLELTRLVQYRDIELILYSQHHFLNRLRSGDEAAPQGEAGHQLSAAQRLARANSLPTRFWIWLYDGMAAVFRQEWEHAVRSLREAETLIWSAPAHINVADCRLYLALALAHAANGAAPDSMLAEVAAHRDCFARWAALNPLTFRGKLALVDAELARLRGDPLQALAGYEQAAAAAAAAGFVHEAALAHELAGMLCEARGLPTAAAQHRRLASAGYRRWGADHKAMLLEARHPHRDVAGHDHGGADGERRAPRWELGMKAARAMSSEIVMDRLIETLMTHVVVHAGAQYGLLLLMRGEQPMIEASARVLDGKVAVTLGSAVPSEQALPLAVLNSVLRTRQTLALDDAMVDAPSIRTKGAIAGGPRSVLCLPLLRGGGLFGVFYLENSLAPAVFDATRIAELEVLAPQVAISLETARLYQQLIDESNRRVAAEVRLRSASSALARTSHLTVMGGLAASIAHEVNQPLTAIVATVDASLRWLNRPRPELAEALDGFTDIKQYALRAADIIRALRALARQAPAVLAPLHPDEVLREVLEMARLDIDAHEVRVVARLAAGAAVVEADRVQLQQVVLNLITNALDAMAQTPPAQRELIVTSYREQDSIVVSVQDQGAGIPDDVLGQVFEPFFTTKADGMGMGLAICRSIIEAHGGRLEVRNRRSGGSEFMFRLPVCEMLPAAGV
ncbi:trifunctional serine/threonine-protein kinase/ATP-binding protein/sensor histidine kinase [Cupriavidus taiwanensis]|uniref:trifunctional serine/threonine-protein kinase/ATP-binding protein/sensor histidine kinase n=1 Tax=Cupriavidus taiwanensis TaxID=164546 RepID=UPI000E10AD60|nr:AAA family ATPase [Cupriavidus taiwanensis]SOY70603.1 putative SENSOR HISTIDINE KINASE with GAF and Pkinase domains [Cupriavidus taiwanensis]SOY72199.1 putative SENSOR HISTIDINE KINASE with GAF and Pkinase domains [Cupriavidus taiwanensis]SOY95764.1 putative SENSOR HISTIDINE KINASE with GAF and Pkinase domains [Cupriavidus taiwanensis]SOZ74978.1 putative SENSOR HISTIDINE KINASE with GAF and Pkinase domains [Cupriavidus taiwanensis]SOZ88511.1 putative SENSOR HISTIDINE KINASE with GAF and Pki